VLIGFVNFIIGLHPQMQVTPKCRLPPNTAQPIFLNTTTTPTSTRDKMVNEQDMIKALTDLESAPSTPYSILATKYNLVPKTISRRWRKITSSRAEITQNSHRHLSDIEEQDLINYIVYLAGYSIYLIPKILNNIIEARLSRQISVN
jgi:hypothetical protein